MQQGMLTPMLIAVSEGMIESCVSKRVSSPQPSTEKSTLPSFLHTKLDRASQQESTTDSKEGFGDRLITVRASSGTSKTLLCFLLSASAALAL